jgi:mono/diheme cytochrome c family protein
MKKTGALLLGLGFLAATPAMAQEAAAGRQVAEKVCSECHFVDSVDFKTSKAPGLLALGRRPGSSLVARSRPG